MHIEEECETMKSNNQHHVVEINNSKAFGQCAGYTVVQNLKFQGCVVNGY